jgi:hypothetical protein
MTQKVYETLNTVQLYDSDESLFVLGRYTYSGQKMKDFHDKLNYSAMVVDYGLMELFSGFLLATPSLQSASISLASCGQMTLQAESLVMSALANQTEALTPSLAVQEGLYTANPGANRLSPLHRLAANGLTQVLLMCAIHKGGTRKIKEWYEQYFNLGVDVLSDKDNGEEGLVTGTAPHETIGRV